MTAGPSAVNPPHFMCILPYLKPTYYRFPHEFSGNVLFSTSVMMDCSSRGLQVRVKRLKGTLPVLTCRALINLSASFIMRERQSDNMNETACMEIGVNPIRYRHCKGSVPPQGHWVITREDGERDELESGYFGCFGNGLNGSLGQFPRERVPLSGPVASGELFSCRSAEKGLTQRPVTIDRTGGVP